MYFSFEVYNVFYKCLVVKQHFCELVIPQRGKMRPADFTQITVLK